MEHNQLGNFILEIVGPAMVIVLSQSQSHDPQTVRYGPSGLLTQRSRDKETPLDPTHDPLHKIDPLCHILRLKHPCYRCIHASALSIDFGAHDRLTQSSETCQVPQISFPSQSGWNISHQGYQMA